MSSQTRDTRGGTNRLDLRTLLIASVSSAVAAIVVSRIWASGTPVAAAATPVIVTFLREALDRPTAAVAARMTAETRALPDTDVREPVPSRVAERMRGTGGPERSTPPADRARERPSRPAGARDDDIRIYRTQPSASAAARRIHPKVILVTGLLAFVIAGLVITGGQVLAGKSGHGAIILGQHKKTSSSEDSQQQDTTTEQQQTTTTTPDQQQTTTTPDQQQTTTTPTTPQQTTPQATPRGQTQTTPGGTPAQP
jgi:Sec-independent protein translocase protein TatA